MDNIIKEGNLFLKKHVGNLGLSSIVVAGFEKLFDSDFACPCQPRYNIWICAAYAIVPFIVSCVFTFLQESNTEVMQGGFSKYLYSLGIGFIWLFFFFIDGRYVVCACSHWGGEYTETGALQWCKPKGNETEVFKRKQESQMCDTISQFTAFGTAGVVVFMFGILHSRGYPAQANEGGIPLSNKTPNETAQE